MQRGKWVLENMLGAHAADAAAERAALEETKTAESHPVTVRERMELHREKPSCARLPQDHGPDRLRARELRRRRPLAHRRARRADRRDRRRSWTARKSTAPTELRNALLKYSDRFVQTVTEKLMTYALGRGLEYYDMPTVRSIAHSAAKNDYRFSSVIAGIVESAPFQMRATETAPEATQIVADR